MHHQHFLHLQKQLFLMIIQFIFHKNITLSFFNCKEFISTIFKLLEPVLFHFGYILYSTSFGLLFVDFTFIYFTSFLYFYYDSINKNGSLLVPVPLLIFTFDFRYKAGRTARETLLASLLPTIISSIRNTVFALSLRGEIVH